MTACECKQCYCTQTTRRPDKICRDCDLQRLTLAVLQKGSYDQIKRTPQEMEIFIQEALEAWSKAQ